MLDTKPGPDAYKVIPDSQLIVTRTAYKNNSSKYTINGRTSTHSEAQTLLKGRGIDLDHNRFLILQVCCSFDTNHLPIEQFSFRVKSSLLLR